MNLKPENVSYFSENKVLSVDPIVEQQVWASYRFGLKVALFSVATLP